MPLFAQPNPELPQNPTHLHFQEAKTNFLNNPWAYKPPHRSQNVSKTHTIPTWNPWRRRQVYGV